MARADAARNDSRLDFVSPTEHRERGSAPRDQQPWLPPASTLMLRFEPWLAKIVPILVAIFLTTLALAAAVQALADRDRTLLTAAREINLDLKLLADRVDQAVPAGNLTQLADKFETLIPFEGLLQSRQIYLIDAETGKILAERANQPSGAKTIGDMIGLNQAVSTLADRAGTMPVSLGDSRSAYAAARNLTNYKAQLVLVAPTDAILDGWGQSILKQSLLLFSVAVLLGIIAVAYFWQAARAREAEVVCDEIRTRIDTALNRGKCGLWDWDIARGRIYWSQSMFEILGMPLQSGSLSLGELRDIMHPGDANLANMAQTIAEGVSQTIDHIFRMRNAAGHWVWLRMRAEVVRANPMLGQRVVGIAMDISEEKNHRDSSHIADIRLRDAIDSISEAFVLWDADNCLAMCNEKFRQLHQISEEEQCNGLTYADFMKLSTPPSLQNQINFDTQKSKSARTYEAQLSDGRWLQVNERRTRDGGYVSVGTDITKLKLHEEQLVQSEKRLIGTVADLRRSRQTLEMQAQQLAELAERYLEQKAEAEAANTTKAKFLANMSHELRTPLNAIIGFSEMMHHETFGPLGHTKYLDYVKSINSSGSYLLSIISDVLEMSRLESGDVLIERRLTAMQPLLGRIMHDFQSAATQKSINLSCHSIANLQVSIDATAFEKILHPLIQNAIKFTSDGGTVIVSTGMSGGTLTLFVEDNGIGISPLALKQLGKPFEQGEAGLQNGMKGSGLGLAIARTFVELHGGKLSIQSQQKRGTKITIMIPNCGAGVEPKSVEAPVREHAAAEV